MKRLPGLALVLLFLTSCGGGGGETPESVARDLLDSIIAGDEEKFRSLLRKIEREMFSGDAPFPPQSDFSYTIGDVIIDGDSAIVKYSYEQGDDEGELALDLIREDGEWRITHKAAFDSVIAEEKWFEARSAAAMIRSATDVAIAMNGGWKGGMAGNPFANEYVKVSVDEFGDLRYFHAEGFTVHGGPGTFPGADPSAKFHVTATPIEGSGISGTYFVDNLGSEYTDK